MAFIDKTDYFSMEDIAGIIVASSNDGKTASVAEAHGDDGSIVASTVYGESDSPSCDCQFCAATVALGSIKLGAVTTVDGDSYMLGSVTINTSAGAAPTMSVSGEQIEDSATQGCSYTIPTASVSKVHHAQILWSAFTLSGSGCHLNSANYTASAQIGKATVNGECVNSDVSEGKIECQITVVQTGATEPTISAGTNWVITAPLACSNPDADYPTWSATVVKYLAKDSTSSSST